MSRLFLLLLTTFLVSNGDENCKWAVNVNNKTLTLDLQSLQRLNEPIQCALDSSTKNVETFEDDWVLVYTPCRNGVNCSIPDKGYNATMVSQISNKSSLPACAAYLGVWDYGKTPPIYVKNKDKDQEEYIFEYKNGYRQQNGNCTNGRWLNVTYICNEDIAEISESNITCRELPYSPNNNNICYYEMMIPTKLACLSDADNNDMSTALRATIWLGIIFGVVFIFYCVTGYILNATRHNQWCDCMGNIPNANLWCCCCYKGKQYKTIQDTGGLINESDQFH